MNEEEAGSETEVLKFDLSSPCEVQMYQAVICQKRMLAPVIVSSIVLKLSFLILLESSLVGIEFKTIH